MKRENVEIAVGVFVLLGLLAVGYLTIKLGKMELLGEHAYLVNARFQSVSGLKKGARVEVAGVEVGKVTAIHLDAKTMDAIVELKVKDGLKLSEDTIASVRTAGLIGDKFIRLSPGGLPIDLAPGETITDTESPLDIEDLIAKYVFGGVDKKGAKDGAKTGEPGAAKPVEMPVSKPVDQPAEKPAASSSPTPAPPEAPNPPGGVPSPVPAPAPENR